MKAKIGIKAVARRSGLTSAGAGLKHQRLIASRLKQPRSINGNAVELFKKAVKGRPTDVSWLMKFGQLGRSMGLTFDEAFSVIRPHYRKLRGNTRRSWIKKGLKMGYAERGLRA